MSGLEYFNYLLRVGGFSILRQLISINFILPHSILGTRKFVFEPGNCLLKATLFDFFVALAHT